MNCSIQSNARSHVYDGLNLFEVSLYAFLVNHEPPELSSSYCERALIWTELHLILLEDGECIL